MLQGFRKACETGHLSGHKVAGVRFVLEDGKFAFIFVFFSL